jgi:hypothetical protein
MNNAFILNETLAEEQVTDPSPVLHKRAEELVDAIEAVRSIANSSYWKVLEKHVFSADLERAYKTLIREKDTTEMFRLQGEIRSLEKFSLDRLLLKLTNELEAIKNKINGTK